MCNSVRSIIAGGIFLAFLFMAGAPGAAEQAATAPPPAKPGLDQLMRMADFLAQLDQFSFLQQSGYDVVQESGQKIEFAESRKLVFDRPNRFRVEVEKSDGKSSVTTYDGKAITVLSLTRKLYAYSEFKGDADGAIIHFVKDLKMRFPLAMLLVTTVPGEFKKNVRQAEVVETAMLDGKSYVHLAVRGDSVDFQVWLPAQGDPLPRRIIITYKLEEGQPQYWANFQNWNLSPSPPESLFSLDVPKDAVRIQFLAEKAKTTTALTAEGEKK